MQDYISVLSVFAMAAMRLLPSFNRIMSNASSVMASLPGLDALCDDMRRASAMRRTLPPQTDAPIHLQQAIRVEGVTFAYPGTETPVFSDVDLVIPKNRSVAFIGPSGAGKTTIADVILGLMQPRKGRVTVDGADIYHSIASWHRLVAYIPQNIYLIDDTIRANVTFAPPRARWTTTGVWQALQSAQLDDFVRSLDHGLDTIVGDQGVKLSGGQRQRIGIAQGAVQRPRSAGADEATSALDNETEKAVMDAINQPAGQQDDGDHCPPADHRARLRHRLRGQGRPHHPPDRRRVRRAAAAEGRKETVTQKTGQAPTQQGRPARSFCGQRRRQSSQHMAA